MARTLAIIVSGLILVGLVVALLPAQDQSSRRARGSIYDTGDVATAGGEAAEPGHFPMDAAADAHAAAPAGDGDADSVRTAQLRRRLQAASGTEESEQEPAAEAQAPATLPDDAQADVNLHSVLKRGLADSNPDAGEPAVLPSSPAMQLAQPDQGVQERPPGATSARRPQRSPRRTAEPTLSDSARTEDVHVGGRSPAIRVELVGPGAVNAGKAGRYIVYASNEGDVPAKDLVVQLPLGNVTLSKGEATAGEAEVQAAADGTPTLVWNLPALAPRGQETLQMQLVAGDGDAFELSLSWSCRPADASARVAIKRPQLNVALNGPADMLLGEERPFKVLVSNPGTGDATGVVVDLTAGPGKPQRIDVGTVPAGQQLEIPVQIMANKPGELELSLLAQGEGELSAENVAKVLVRSAELAIAIDGPQLKFAGAEATYVIVVANRGNAAGEAANISIDLPTGAKYLGGVESAAPGKGNVKWSVGTLGPGAEKRYEIQCQLMAEGENRIVATAEAKHAPSVSGEAVTTVEAVADLKLTVNDPSGPSPVGEEIEYEVLIANRGTRAAQQVKVVVQFGDGLEPASIAGGTGKVVPGQVICDPLPSLEAGEQVSLKVRAKAEKVGTHQFRVEVTSGESRLVSEGTSRFFSETRASAAAAPAIEPPEKPAGTRPPTQPTPAGKTSGRPTPAAPKR